MVYGMISRVFLKALFLTPFVLAALLLLPGGAKPEGGIMAWFSPDGGIEEAIKEAIDGAQKEILVGMYQFTNRDLAQALVAAQKRGVKVMCILDADQIDEKFAMAPILKEGGIELKAFRPVYVKGSASSPKYHQKYAVIDERLLITGSFNWTTAADRQNHENIVVLEHAGLAKMFREQFIKVWKTDSAPGR